jgi:hypothetical protein
VTIAQIRIGAVYPAVGFVPGQLVGISQTVRSVERTGVAEGHMGDSRLRISHQQDAETQDPTGWSLSEMGFHGFAQFGNPKD